ncbi:MAG TPA: hypothetical protein VEA99_19305 [Gemmatimonadaceae bacterium]|nr:hypothetical protein [Gemmatimonadaceae bacterium]
MTHSPWLLAFVACSLTAALPASTPAQREADRAPVAVALTRIAASTRPASERASTENLTGEARTPLRKSRYAAVGAAYGFVVGAGVAYYHICWRGDACFDVGEATFGIVGVAFWGGVGTGAGALVGAVIGAAIDAPRRAASP